MIVRSLLLCIVSLMVWAAEAPVYYVDASIGSDSNSGTSSAPWKTIQKAANTVEPGSVVSVNAGTYNERVALTRSGSVGAPVTFQARGTVVTQGFTIYADYVRVVG